MVNSAGTVRETKALAKKFVRYKEGAELYSMVQTSQQNTIQLKNRFQKSQSRVMWQSLRAWVTELQALYHLKRVHSFRKRHSYNRLKRLCQVKAVTIWYICGSSDRWSRQY